MCLDRTGKKSVVVLLFVQAVHKLLLAMKEKVQQEKQMLAEVSKSLQTIDMTQQEQYDLRCAGRTASHLVFPRRYMPHVYLADWSVE